MKTTATSLVVNFEQVWRQIVTFVLDRLSWEDSAIVRLLTEMLKSFKDTLSIEDFGKVWPLTHFFLSVCVLVCRLFSCLIDKDYSPWVVKHQTELKRSVTRPYQQALVGGSVCFHDSPGGQNQRQARDLLPRLQPYTEVGRICQTHHRPYCQWRGSWVQHGNSHFHSGQHTWQKGMKFFCSFVPVRKYRLKDEKEHAEGIWEEQHLLEVAKEINCAAGKFSQLFYNDLHMIFFTLDVRCKYTHSQ